MALCLATKALKGLLLATEGSDRTRVSPGNDVSGSSLERASSSQEKTVAPALFKMLKKGTIRTNLYS